MPISVKELRATRPGELIAEDRPCRGCKFNLRGLTDSGVCPECGRPIRQVDVARFSDQMVDAPLAWLLVYQRGTMLLCVGGWTMAVGLLGWGVFGRVGWLVGALVGSIAWAVGTVVSTRPRPRTKAMTIDPSREWTTWRAWARLSQPAWCCAIAGLIIIQMMGWYHALAVAPAALCLLVGVVGWWPLMVLQSNLAYWASDTDLADRLRICSWASAPGMGIGVAMVSMIGGMNGGLTGTRAVIGMFASAMVLSLWVGLGLLSLWYTLATVWHLSRLGTWVVVAHLKVDMRDEQMRERARRARNAALASRAESGD